MTTTDEVKHLVRLHQGNVPQLLTLLSGQLQVLKGQGWVRNVLTVTIDPIYAQPGVINVFADVFEGKAISAAEVTKLADLESREVLLAKLAGAMKGNLTKAAATFQAPLAQVARLAAALQDKRAQDGSAEA